MTCIKGLNIRSRRLGGLEMMAEYAYSTFLLHSSPDIAFIYHPLAEKMSKTAAGLYTRLYTDIRRNPKHPLPLAADITYAQNLPFSVVT
jgi:hypothetical protein